ncbi:hypothetical protein [Alicyclobacillus ferrooxydans]|uniref:Uncharacterized protein n=1 Tax=Alicyclobacillus ferrooxydans TaxID=471514 RepID=A0A0P9CQE0_9BACL|nr:hypothetical protein [Alicyclobacillus ferrooxydans]KPV45120.1 hypothetical protein AN477_03805 [Alicyclobacillus ferrooxydans]
MTYLDNVIYRRLNMTPPENCTVVPRSTPVIAFGRYKTAPIATVSLNPSYREFQLVGGQHRFQTLDTLDVCDYGQLQKGDCKKILDYCERYFERPGIPLDWFKRLGDLLGSITGKSYADGIACHLDISQWATREVWANLNEDQKQALLEHDLEVLKDLIVHGPYRAILLNGWKTAKEVFRILNLRPTRVSLRKTYTTDEGTRKPKVDGYYVEVDSLLGAPLNRRLQVFGWNVYAKYAGKDSLELIANWIREQLHDLNHVEAEAN